jgi:hypothetical protein
MLRTMEDKAIAALDRATERPPILEATRALAMPDRLVARLLGVTPEAVNAWAYNKRPVPRVRHVALLFVVARLAGIVGANFPTNSRYARRAAIARDSAEAWAALARDELTEACGGYIPDDLIVRGYEQGEKALARLEAQ